MPEFKSSLATGADLRAVDACVLRQFEPKIIKTGLILADVKYESLIARPTLSSIGYIPDIQIRPRSGIASQGVILVNSPATIDRDYRGEIMIILLNLIKKPFVINRGDRIAQLVVNLLEEVTFETTQEIIETERGAGGLGSTGVK